MRENEYIVIQLHETFTDKMALVHFIIVPNVVAAR